MKRVKRDIFQSCTALLVLAITIISSFLISNLIPSGNSSIEKARELGIVSLTVLSGYSKSAEVYLYMSNIFFLVIFSIMAGIISRKKIENKISSIKTGRNLTTENIVESPKDKKKLLTYNVDIVEMENFFIARYFKKKSNLNIIFLRVVLDSYKETLPHFDTLNPVTGRPTHFSLLKTFFSHPLQMILLGINFNFVLHSLKKTLKEIFKIL